MPVIRYDCEIDFEEITPKFFRVLKQLEPFGPENLSPVFLCRNIKSSRFTRTVGEGKNHLKLHVHQIKSPQLSMEGIGFDLGHWAEKLKDDRTVDLLFSLDENTWNQKTTLQLIVKDIRESTADAT